MSFALGQRWISDSESDLGLGTVVAIEGRMITILFPASGENRLYAREEAPVTRVRFNPGDTITAHDESQLIVSDIVENDGLITYIGCPPDSTDVVELKETFLNNAITFNKPQDRLFAGQIDRNDRFVLRYQALCHQHRESQSDLVGLKGARVSLIPHQLYIAREVGHRYAPRVLLADEVGLGKTIEAGLIIHQQLLSGRAERVLIIVPETLQHQWLIEMMRRFNLHFSIFDEERCQESMAEDDNPFDTAQLVLCSLDFLRKKRVRFEQVLETEWDLLVVDEAHHLIWDEKRPSREYQIVEALGAQTPGLLLLTATPDQLGHESHFARLRLLDADRFFDYDTFVEEERSYAAVADAVHELTGTRELSNSSGEAIASLLNDQVSDEDLQRAISGTGNDSQSARQDLIRKLLDQHGTGRILFRNTRHAIQGFPKREYRPVRLDMPSQYKTAMKVASMMARTATPEQAALQALYPEAIYQQFEGESATWWNFDPRVTWLAEFLLKHRSKKVLLICAKLETTELLEEALRLKEGIRAAVFHEKMSIIERDKAGAYFAQEEGGAQVLLCSEIGSEGRNFQFSHHLVLFDLPLNPDLLEQRIGRLDRIGQRQDIQIHLPYFTDSAQDILQAWYHQGLNAFEEICATGSPIYAMFSEQLMTCLASSTGEAELLEATSAEHQALKSRMEGGRDRLLELNSGGHGKADDIIEQLKEQDDDPTLALFALRLFDIIGVEQEDNGENGLIIRPSEHMLVPDFPGLPIDGCTVTFDREQAISRDDLVYLTWEHPIIRTGFDLMLTSDTGSTSVCLLKSRALPAGTTFLEVIYTIETTARDPQLARYLPKTPLRLLLDRTGKNLGENVGFDSFNRQLSPLNRHIASKLVGSSQPLIHQQLQAAEKDAQQLMERVMETARESMQQELSDELERLKALQLVNPSIRQEELTHLEEKRDRMTSQINQAKLGLDAIRFIVVTPD